MSRFLNIISAYVYKGIGKQSLLPDIFSWSGHRLSQKRLVHFNVDGIDFSISLVLNPIKPRDIAFVIRRQLQALQRLPGDQRWLLTVYQPVLWFYHCAALGNMLRRVAERSCCYHSVNRQPIARIPCDRAKIRIVLATRMNSQGAEEGQAEWFESRRCGHVQRNPRCSLHVLRTWMYTIASEKSIQDRKLHCIAWNRGDLRKGLNEGWFNILRIFFWLAFSALVVYGKCDCAPGATTVQKIIKKYRIEKPAAVLSFEKYRQKALKL
jgi:hypothetical protein